MKVYSWEDMAIKYPEDRHMMTEEKHIEFVNDCYKLYEKDGFAKKFWTPYSCYMDKRGLPFEVVKRCTADEADLECLPAWIIKFEDGEEAMAYPEEIIPFEMLRNGCLMEGIL